MIAMCLESPPEIFEARLPQEKPISMVADDHDKRAS